MTEKSSDQKTAVSTSKIPTESRLNTAWDTCIEQAIVKTGYGLAVGGLSAFILFRSPTSRSLIAGLGAGFGAGVSYNDCKGLLCQRGLSNGKCPASSKCAKSEGSSVSTDKPESASKSESKSE